MKKLLSTIVIISLIGVVKPVTGQDQNDYLGLPGDNLNLYAVMKLFQESKTLEEFERNLNDENSRINNLDLNGDNLIDYIQVNDYVDRNVHNIVLQDAINEREIQDVAVFNVQRFSNGEVQIQLTGDEDLYGKDYIIEPIFDDVAAGQTPNPGYIGNNRTINGRSVTVTRTSVVEISAWPLVRFIFLPDYLVWSSSWHWGYYPHYWHPWRPYYWHYYYGYHHSSYNYYYGHYRLWNSHRYSRFNDFYYSGIRHHSPVVVQNINTGHYKSTYSHPEQIRGEALYTKTYKGQTRREQVNNNANVRTGRSSSEQSQVTGTGNTSVRRSQTTTTTRSSTDPQQRVSRTTTRRQVTSEGNKSAVSRRSERRSVVNKSSDQSTSKANSPSKRRTARSAKPGKAEQKKPESNGSESGRRNP